MEIRRTTVEDLPRLLALYARARQFMADHGNPNQWGPPHWPRRPCSARTSPRGRAMSAWKPGGWWAPFSSPRGRTWSPLTAASRQGPGGTTAPMGWSTGWLRTGRCRGSGGSAFGGPMPNAAICGLTPTGTTGSCRPCWRRRAFSPAAPFTWRRTPTPGWPMKRARAAAREPGA